MFKQYSYKLGCSFPVYTTSHNMSHYMTFEIIEMVVVGESATPQ